MINLPLAILFSTLIMVTFKLFERYRIDTIQAITVNYVVAVAFGLITYRGDLTPAEVVQLPWYPYASVIGVFFILVFFVFATSARKVGIAITAVSSKMSVIIPVLVGVLIMKNDSLNVVKTIGILLALIAFYLTFKKREAVSIRKRYVFLPLLLFLGNGTNDSLQSYTTYTFGTNLANHTTLMLIVVFGTALVIGTGISLWRAVVHKVGIAPRNMIAGTVLGLLNFLSTYYFLRSLDFYPNTVFFPVFNAGIVAMSALTGLFLFKEQLRPINKFGIVLAVIAIIVIARGG